MPAMCANLSCEYSFNAFNKIFKDGVPPEIAKAVTTTRLKARKTDQLYDMDMADIGESMKSHFEKDWMGIGGESWFGPGAGDLLYKTFVNAIKTAGPRQIKAIWVQSDTVKTQTLEDDNLVLVLVGSPRPPQGKVHKGDCGVSGEALD